VDFFSIPDEEVMAYLLADLSPFEGGPPPTPEFLADRYRESTSFARVGWKRPYDLKLQKWLHRITVPTLLLWGEADRLIPAAQAPVWADEIPNASVKTFPGAGHLLFDESREAVDAVGGFVGAEVKA
jgi:pimeloyl-ACP methyl ester carboxylesterase